MKSAQSLRNRTSSEEGRDSTRSQLTRQREIGTNFSPGGLMRPLRKRLYSIFPQRVKVIASDLAFRFSDRPHVYFDPAVHPPKRLKRGAVTFSIDFELAWAWVYAKGMNRGDAVALGLHERAQVPEILASMDELRIPATWATVGHLFLEKCERNAEGFAHAEVRSMSHFETKYWSFTSGDWYQVDPCTDFKRDPAWYAPDLIEQILGAAVSHEIGCHSFSHGGLGPYCPNDVAESKIDACLNAMRPYGIVPKTWVFPGNDIGNFDALAKKGFKNVRYFPIPEAEISLPIRREDGMWNVFDSTPIDLEGSGWNYAKRLERLKKYVDKAIETKLAAHFWFHPSIPAEQMNELLIPLFRYCAQQRDKGQMDILTVDQLVEATASAFEPANGQ